MPQTFPETSPLSGQGSRESLPIERRSSHLSQGQRASATSLGSRRSSMRISAAADSFQGVSLDQCAARGIEIISNEFVLPHGWVAGCLILEFHEHFIEILEEQPATLGEMTERVGVATGPVVLVLRAASVLGFVKYDDQTRKYSLERGPELTTLEDILSPQKAPRQLFRKVFNECVPPFDLDSKATKTLLGMWRDQRFLWKECDHAGIALLFDGIILTPLLASLAYLARWNEEGNERDDYKDGIVSLKRCPKPSLPVLIDIIRELGLGEVDANHPVLRFSEEGGAEWRRLYDYFMPSAHARLLREFPYILTENASWGFIEEAEDEEGVEEEMIDKQLHTVGMNILRQPYHRELLNQVNSVFSGRDFEKQPKFIVDINSTDGSLLGLVFDFIRSETPRGMVLTENPITLVAMAPDEDSRVKTSSSLLAKGVPHKVVKGNSSDPVKAMAALTRAKVDLMQCLHLQAFANLSRSYVPPRKKLPRDSACAEFAKSVLGETIHLDKYGNQLLAVNIFASLVEHLERWASVARGGPGICMVDVLQMNEQTLSKFFNDSAAFHEELLHSLSRRYVVPPVAFHLAAGMAGLLPPNPKLVGIYPRHQKYVRHISQHATTQDFKIRLAELSDIDRFMELEKLAWEEHLRAPREGILKRLTTSPTTCFAVTMEDEVVAVLYTQRIPSLDTVFNEKFQQVSDWHDPKGSIIQLIAINVDPRVRHLGLAQHLRVFALRFAQLEPTVKSVCAVTICRNYKNYDGTMEDYMDDHVSQVRIDPTVDFHTGFGAKFISLVHGYRPEDVDNKGNGVLVHYNIQTVLQPPDPAQLQKRMSSRVSFEDEVVEDTEEDIKEIVEEIPMRETQTIDLLRSIMEPYEVEVTQETMSQSMFSHGLDSLELVQIRKRLAGDLGIELPSTFLLDYPTLESVIDRLDEIRGAQEEEQPIKKDKERKAQDSDASSQADTDKGETNTISVPHLMDYLIECKRKYALPQHQTTFKEIAQSSYPDMMKYTLQIEPYLMQIQAPILQSHGLLSEEVDYESGFDYENMKHEANRDAIDEVQKARAKIAGTISHYWIHEQEVRKLVQELTTIAKLDQRW